MTVIIDMEPSAPVGCRARPILDLLRHGHDVVKPAVRKVHDRRGPDIVRHEGLQVVGFAWMKPGTITNPMIESNSRGRIDLIGIDVHQTSWTPCFMNNRLGVKLFMWSFRSVVNLGVLFELKKIYLLSYGYYLFDSVFENDRRYNVSCVGVFLNNKL
jgi:hypothetical protein